ncbi:universal stress protein [Microbispora rosea subsp. aerata]|nr:universal stress protein [Microbispora rosea]GGO20140.1 universal stress protein [Microbispora rosea subsp. aerata]GIH57081.1 universal stress protein [Microbispora rosea subsp. aerata]GLJ83538.1 universal stress protein [Microbispora rosea subsp. aerata]
MTGVVIAGTDGSRAAAAAVEWAAGDAARKGLPLRIVHAVDRLPYEIVRYPIPMVEDQLDRAGRRILEEAGQAVRETHPAVHVTTALIEGNPSRVLRQEAGNAAEIVVGSRGHGGFAGMLLGSVSMHVAGQVEVPVVVVRPGVAPPHGLVVVGIDGSDEAGAALDYAFEEARLRDCRLLALYAWQLPVYPFAPEIAYDVDEVRKAQEDYVAGALRSQRDRYPGVRAEMRAVCSHPVPALVEAGEKADLLVVGSRGHGAVGSAVLGSVSRAVLHHAHCPVAVVRRPRS